MIRAHLATDLRSLDAGSELAAELHDVASRLEAGLLVVGDRITDHPPIHELSWEQM